MPKLVKQGAAVKAFDLSTQELIKHIRRFKLPDAKHPNGMLAKIYASALNYLNLGEISPGGELYLVATVLKKRMETRFLLAGPAANDKYHIVDWKGNSKAGIARLKPVLIHLKETIDDISISRNPSKNYLSTFDPETFFTLYKATRLPEQSDKEIDNYLVELYDTANRDYHQGTGESTLSDFSFDQLRLHLIKLGLIDAAKTGAPPAPGTKKVELKTPLGSLENAFNPKELKDWFKKYPSTEYFIQTPKIDGISGQVNYVKGVLTNGSTKGDGYIGEDITALLKAMPDTPRKLKRPLTISIRTELFMKNSTFLKKYGPKSGRTKVYKTARNMVSGQKNRKTPDLEIAKDISILGYAIIDSKDDKETQLELIKSLGFPVVQYNKIRLSSIDKSDAVFQQYKKDNDYLMDGAVIELNNSKLRTNFVAGKINPRFGIAYKPETEEIQAEIKNISASVTKDRYIIPGAVFKTPVTIGGVEVKASNLHHYNKVRDWGLGPGALVIVQRSGDAIPHITRVVKKVKPQYPDNLDYEWNSTEVDLILKKGVASEEHEIEKINTFFTALSVEKFSEGLIKLFYASGYKTIPDILRMTKEDIINDVPRQGQTSASNIIAEFKKLKNPGVKLPDLMYASGCFGRGLGQGKFVDLYNEYGDNLVSGWAGMRLDDIASSIADIHGFSVNTGKQFAIGIKPYIAFYKSVKDVIYIRKQEKSQGGKLSGQVITPTDFRDKILGKKIESLGGVYSDSFSGKTTLLLAPNLDITSTKAQRARAKGIPIMSRGEFVKKYNLE